MRCPPFIRRRHPRPAKLARVKASIAASPPGVLLCAAVDANEAGKKVLEGIAAGDWRATDRHPRVSLNEAGRVGVGRAARLIILPNRYPLCSINPRGVDAAAIAPAHGMQPS